MIYIVAPQKYRGTLFSFGKSSLSKARIALDRELDKISPLVQLKKGIDFDTTLHSGVRSACFISFTSAVVTSLSETNLTQKIEHEPVSLAVGVDGIQLFHNGRAGVIFGFRPIDKDACDPETGEKIKHVSR